MLISIHSYPLKKCKKIILLSTGSFLFINKFEGVLDELSFINTIEK
jgi:hypothetical protein